MNDATVPLPAPTAIPGGIAAEESRRCAHCGSLLAGDGSGDYCCDGCAAAHAIISGLGLDAFYARRAIDPALRPLKPEDDAGVDYVRYAQFDERSGESTLHLMVDGLQCAACAPTWTSPSRSASCWRRA